MQVNHRALTVHLDSRDWTAVQKNVHPGHGTNYVLELLPKGQTLSDWTEMVTIEYFTTPSQPIEPRAFEQEFLKRLSAGHPGIGYHVVAENLPDSLLFTWQAVADSRLENQQGLVRILSGRDGLHVVEYTSRTPLNDEQMQDWQHLLESAQLEKVGA